MKKITFSLTIIVLLAISPAFIFAQQVTGGSNSITASDLESHLSFLASPLLNGRMNGEEGLEIASRYIASQAKKLGLKPANGKSYFQSYTIIKKSLDPEKTSVRITAEGEDTVTIKESLFQLFPTGAADFDIEGEVAFAGYGIKIDKYKYNDFDSLETEGKILLVMDRAPLTPDGGKCLFEEQNWITMTGLQMKIQTLMFTRAKAIIFVTDPKSGSSSVEEAYPGLAGHLKSSMTLKGQKNQIIDFPGVPRVLFVHRKVADQLLLGTGHTLTELQNSIDNNLKSNSFAITGKKIRITEVSVKEEKELQNVTALIEGSDPILKSEIVVFSGHMDHIGVEGGKINAGADDDASGCSALLEMAEAFQGLKKKPLRSILFLWVSGEEIGLFGSKFYVNNPLYPLEKTVADLNMDMIGRIKGIADTTKQTPMTGPNSVFVITDNQSKELLSIAGEASRKTKINLDYSLSGRDHPLMLFARSDHYNFVRKDIPVLFFTTGLHTDYHKPGDVIERIDFQKMELVTRTMYEIGYIIANRKTRIVVDNPFSTWENTVGKPGQ